MSTASRARVLREEVSDVGARAESRRTPGSVAGEDVLPLRPLTTGELLDAAISLLRRHALVLLVAGLLLAAAEQAVLYPLRKVALRDPLNYLTPWLDHLGRWWLLVALGMGTECLIIALLGGLAGRAAATAVLGEAGHPLRGLRLGHLVPLALLVGLGGFVCAAAGMLPWLVWYFFTGLAAPVLAVDRRLPRPPGRGTPPAGRPAPGQVSPGQVSPGQFAPGQFAPGQLWTGKPFGAFRALGRSFALVAKGGGRPGGVRLLGYLAWYAIRLAVGFGGVRGLALVLPPTSGSLLIGIAAWVVVNTIAYSALACLDAVLHLENRMRVEGLDIALSRAERQGTPAAPVMAVPQ
jgi:hypothetical protein